MEIYLGGEEGGPEFWAVWFGECNVHVCIYGGEVVDGHVGEAGVLLGVLVFRDEPSDVSGESYGCRANYGG